MDIITYILAKNASKKYTDEAIEKIPTNTHYKGQVNYYTDLPEDPEPSDMYTVKYKGTSGTEISGAEYVWEKDYSTEPPEYTWIYFGQDFTQDIAKKADNELTQINNWFSATGRDEYLYETIGEEVSDFTSYFNFLKTSINTQTNLIIPYTESNTALLMSYDISTISLFISSILS